MQRLKILRHRGTGGCGGGGGDSGGDAGTLPWQYPLRPPARLQAAERTLARAHRKLQAWSLRGGELSSPHKLSSPFGVEEAASPLPPWALLQAAEPTPAILGCSRLLLAQPWAGCRSVVAIALCSAYT